MFDFDRLTDEELARKLYTIWQTEMQVNSLHTWDELVASPHVQEVDAWKRLALFVKQGF